MIEKPIPFQFIGNALPVDFVNTKLIHRGRLIDLIESDGGLADWMSAAGLVVKHRQSPSLKKTRELRDAISEAFHAHMDGHPPSKNAMMVINDHIARYRLENRLRYQDGEFFIEEINEGLSAEGVYSLLAYQAAELLISTKPEALKICSGSDCVLMFKDMSRGQKRRWCSMETCGNRAKAAAHYRNTKKTTNP